MGIEIEKKFLVKGDGFKELGLAVHYQQGYLSTDKGRVVRVRAIDDKAFMTIKGISKGATRAEYEYEIPLEDAREMLQNLCLQPIIEKYRYKVPYEGFTWEVDEFLGENKGLILAEIELESENQDFDVPSWIGEEVTGDPKYFNSNLVQNPYKNW